MNQHQPSVQSSQLQRSLSPAHLQDGSLVVSNFCHEQILAGSSNGTIILAVRNKFGCQYAPSALDLWRLRKWTKQQQQEGKQEGQTDKRLGVQPKLKSIKAATETVRLDKPNPVIETRQPLGSITNQLLMIKDKLPEHIAAHINREQVRACRVKGITVLSQLSCIARQVGSLNMPYHRKIKYEGHTWPNEYIISPQFLSCEGCELFLSREDNERVRRTLSRARGNK